MISIHFKRFPHNMMRRFFLAGAGTVSLLVCWSLLFFDASAQTAPITSSGLNTQVGGPTNVGGKVQYDITGGTRPGNGPNLYHSFGEFGVPTNNIANFLNDSGRATSNILGRVTGGNPSNIFGAIQTREFGNANLFLMNPAGIVFGPNATLDVGGSVHFTTADYLRLTDGVRFNAIPNAAADALLSIAPVAAFGFLSSSPAAISVQGSALSVPSGQSISLVGGDISIQAGALEDGTSQGAHLLASSGQIRLASVASPNEILHPTMEVAANINGQKFSSMGTITLTENAKIDVSGDAGGTVLIRGGQLVMNNALISADTDKADGAPIAIDINLTGNMSVNTVDVPALKAMTTGSGAAGEIRILSQSIDVSVTAVDNFNFSAIDTHTSGTGKGGNVSITTGDVHVTGDPNGTVFFINSGTTGPEGGHGGDISLTAKNVRLDTVSIGTGDVVALFLGEDATGSAGNMTITADTLQLKTSSIITDAFLNGRGGDITISVRDIQLKEASFLSLTGKQKAGALRITADSLIVDQSQFEASTILGPEQGGGFSIEGKVIEFRNGSTIASQAFGDGAAGDIRITATDHLTMSDDPTVATSASRPSGLYTSSLGTRGRLGNAGAIVVTTPRLDINSGARIDSATQSSGHGGPITVIADQISISGERTDPILERSFRLGGLSSGIKSRTVGSAFCSGTCGNAGPISITTGTLNIDQGAEITSGTTSTGKGGDIAITAGQSINLSSRAIISANSTGAGDAGSITISARDSFVMRDSTVNTSTTQSPGGNITIQAGNLVQLVDSQITTNVQGGIGNGGNIIIDPPTVLLDHSNIIASAVEGHGGDITIVAGVFLASPDSIIDASSTFGLSGTINIESPITNLSGTLAPLPQGFVQPAAFAGRCAARLQGGQNSSLVVRTSRDRVPAEPGELLLSPLFASTQVPSVARRSHDLDVLRAGLTGFPVPGGCPS